MQLLLQKDEIIEAGGRQRGVQIICHAGSCWVTIAGDQRDFLLRGGKRLEVFSQGAVCISALHESRVQLLPATEKLSWWKKVSVGRLIWTKKRALPY